jgi:hypothetical protein
MPKGDKIRKLATSWKLKLFMLQKLPLAFVAGLKVTEISPSGAQVRIPYKHLNVNPFKSMYFAAQAMAAELSTGILALAAVQDEEAPISMLVLNMQAAFTKKATSAVVFSCNEGDAIAEAVHQAKLTGEGQTITVKSRGFDKNNEMVSEFDFTWTFKSKSKKP